MGDFEEDGQRYVSLAGLRMHGWTGPTVQRLLGAADRLSVNPRFRDAPQVRLYRLERVEAAEQCEEFRAVAESSGRRSEAVRAAVRRRREQVLERIRSESIDVPRLDPGKLALRAVEHRARREAEWGRAGSEAEGAPEWGRAESSRPGQERGPADRASLDPWKVDCLRHRLSHYDQLLDGLPDHGRNPGGRRP